MLLVYDSGAVRFQEQPFARRTPHVLEARKEPKLVRADLVLDPVYKLRTVSHSLIQFVHRQPLPLVHLTRLLRLYLTVEGRVVWGSPATAHDQELLLPGNLHTHPLKIDDKDTVVAADEIRCGLFPNAQGEHVPAYDISFTVGDGTGLVEACTGMDGTFALAVTGKDDIDHDASGSFTFTKDTFELSMWLRLYAE